MKVGVVDIGTNSMRLLITDGVVEVGRWVEVTGLGRGVDRTGMLSPAAIGRTIPVLAGFGSLMDHHRVTARKAIATSASRDASNRDEFLGYAQSALGVRPVLISGEEEARYAFRGAAGNIQAVPPVLVSDIGGGSTELVTATDAISIDIGSVRLTERALPSRPALEAEMTAARALLDEVLGDIHLDAGTLIGVAGTWTSLAAIAQQLPEYSPALVHGHRLTRSRLAEVTEMLAGMTLEQTEAIPALDPKRAPVILAGGLVAEKVMDAVGAPETLVSERDSLDGVAMEMLALP